MQVFVMVITFKWGVQTAPVTDEVSSRAHDVLFTTGLMLTHFGCPVAIACINNETGIFFLAFLSFYIREFRKELSANLSRRFAAPPKTLLFIVIVFFISWCPSSVLFIVYSIEPTLVFPRLPLWALLSIGWLVNVNSLLNPLCYAISQPLFRKTVLGLLTNPMRYCRG